ncbi:Endonuclease/exonuclease/phosphatase, partial [Nadsonia fulvescens var. elongata DSM 6958]
MTYNVLGQRLIRRKLFPTSGEAVKWKNRSRVLYNEICHYDPDVLCLQEVDAEKVEEFWALQVCERLGFKYVYSSVPGKLHGQIIAWRETILELEKVKEIVYDEISLPGVKQQVNTKNTAVYVSLKFVDIRAHKTGPADPTAKTGILVGTTHLFWHPYGSYERTRQSAIYLEQAERFYQSIKNQGLGDKYMILTGDFNSTPWDGPYYSITATRPVVYDDITGPIMRESLDHVFTRGAIEEEGDDDEDEQKDDNTPSKTPSANLSTKNLPGDSSTTPSYDTVEQLAQYYSTLPIMGKSLYGLGYRYVDPDNIDHHTKKHKHEPRFSNWAHTWQGLLDYIFIMKPASERHEESLDLGTGVRLLQLLKLPRPEEMGPVPNGQPREGQYPSDHISLMATVAL